MLTIWTDKIKHSTVGSSFRVTFSVAPNELEYLTKLYDCFNSMNWRSFPITADRKTESNSEIPNNSTKATISKMEQVDEPQTCSVNGRPYDCGNCEYFKCTADEPQTETEIAKAIVHKMIDNSVIAEDAYPGLRQRMHEAVERLDEYYPSEDERSE